jgi:S-formylglutathione hydrolase
METISEIICFGGKQGVYRHMAETTRCEMEFSVFTPPQAIEGQKVPVIWYLSGLTCTQENVTTKAGFQRVAAELGLMVICPDTSPRGTDIADADTYDMGQGAGFYLNATEAPWSQHYQMYDYVVKELSNIIAQHFPADLNRQAITGHSMGGHGALTIGLKNPDQYRSISAFSPIVAPTNVPWGQKAFTEYLGPQSEAWDNYDACKLMHASQDRGSYPPILIDQGTADNFLDEQLKPHLFSDACSKTGQKLTLRMQDGYDHSYFFIASFIEDHLRHHHQYLK